MVLQPQSSDVSPSHQGATAAATASGSSRQPRRKVGRWSQQETDLFITLVKQIGRGKWKRVLEMSDGQLTHRSQVDLKDKWRNLEKQGMVPKDYPLDPHGSGELQGSQGDQQEQQGGSGIDDISPGGAEAGVFEDPLSGVAGQQGLNGDLMSGGEEGVSVLGQSQLARGINDGFADMVGADILGEGVVGGVSAGGLLPGDDVEMSGEMVIPVSMGLPLATQTADGGLSEMTNTPLTSFSMPSVPDITLAPQGLVVEGLDVEGVNQTVIPPPAVSMPAEGQPAVLLSSDTAPPITHAIPPRMPNITMMDVATGLPATAIAETGSMTLPLAAASAVRLPATTGHQIDTADTPSQQAVAGSFDQAAIADESAPSPKLEDMVSLAGIHQQGGMDAGVAPTAGGVQAIGQIFHGGVHAAVGMDPTSDATALQLNLEADGVDAASRIVPALS